MFLKIVKGKNQRRTEGVTDQAAAPHEV